MRKLTLALAVGLLVAGTGHGREPRRGRRLSSAYVTKVVIVVGQTQGATASYIADADKPTATDFQAAADAAGRSVSIVKVYSPNATWSAVQAAAKGANILVYMGHGNGYPNPYVSYEQPLKDNGMGLNDVAGTSSSTTYYYGEAYMAQLQLAPNAMVILNHLCYASGNSEGGCRQPNARRRPDAGRRLWLRLHSGRRRGRHRRRASHDIGYYIDALFNGHMTVDAMWKSSPPSTTTSSACDQLARAPDTRRRWTRTSPTRPGGGGQRSLLPLDGFDPVHEDGRRHQRPHHAVRQPERVLLPGLPGVRLVDTRSEPRWAAGPTVSPVAGTPTRSPASRCRWALTVTPVPVERDRHHGQPDRHQSDRLPAGSTWDRRSTPPRRPRRSTSPRETTGPTA